MIFTKESLLDTWIENDEGELRELYLEVCANVGYATYMEEVSWYDLKRIGVMSPWHSTTSGNRVGQTNSKGKNLGGVELTLEDLRNGEYPETHEAHITIEKRPELNLTDEELTRILTLLDFVEGDKACYSAGEKIGQHLGIFGLEEYSALYEKLLTRKGEDGKVQSVSENEIAFSFKD